MGAEGQITISIFFSPSANKVRLPKSCRSRGSLSLSSLPLQKQKVTVRSPRGDGNIHYWGSHSFAAKTPWKNAAGVEMQIFTKNVFKGEQGFKIQGTASRVLLTVSIYCEVL